MTPPVAPAAIHTWRPILAWIFVALAYAIAFLQRVSPQTVLDVLAQDFGSTWQGVSILASAYFYGYTMLQIPAGILIDSFGVRRVMLACLAISAAGTVLFAVSPDLSTASLARMVVASGDALVFTAMIKLVALRFADGRFGLMSGLSQVSGYIGGLIAATPLALAVAAIGWRMSFGAIAGVIVVNWLALYFLLPAAPVPAEDVPRKSVLQAVRVTLIRMVELARTRASWGCALTFSAHFVAITSLSGVWGIPMLMQAYRLDRAEASAPMFVFTLTTIVGCIVFGYLADRVRSLFAVLVASCVARMVLIGCLAPSVGDRFGMVFVTVSFALLGLMAGGTVPVVLKCMKRIYSTAYIGVGGSINTTLAGLITAVAQPIIGAAVGAAPVEGGAVLAYDTLVGILIAVSVLGIVGPLLMRRSLDAERIAPDMVQPHIAQ